MSLMTRLRCTRPTILGKRAHRYQRLLETHLYHRSKGLNVRAGRGFRIKSRKMPFVRFRFSQAENVSEMDWSMAKSNQSLGSPGIESFWSDLQH